MRKFLALLLAVSSLACQATDDPSATAPLRGGRRGGYVLRDPKPLDEALRFGPGPQHRVLYMNRFGGTYTRSTTEDDSSRNMTTIPTVASATVAPFPDGDASWNDLVVCVRQMFGPFNITVTETDPGAMPHIESVVAGLPTDLGLDPNYLGIASMYSDCSVNEHDIVFTFPEPHQGSVEEMCATVAQESAHALGLDHELECLDPMTYRPYCGPRSFQNEPVDCGEDTPRTCACGGSTQNSHEVLMQVLGMATGDSIPPNLSFVRPQNGQVVAPSFEIEGSASDSAGIQNVILYIDGSQMATDTSAPYVFTAPDGLTFGQHTIELRATDQAGNMTPKSIMVDLQDDGGEGGGGPGGGGGGETGMGGMGATCTGDSECTSGFCSGAGVCSTSCDPTSTTACGAGFECVAYESGGGECLPAPGSTLIGGCEVSRRGTQGAAAILLGLALALLIREGSRSRRSSSRGRPF